MVTLAQAAEDVGYSSVWVADHFSGSVVGGEWSRDAFVCLGAMAATTNRLELGVLVANMRNRHPAQLASAVNSLQSLAPERIRLGIGSGAVPGSRFAVEHEAIGTDLGSVEERRSMLADSIKALRAIWSGEHDVATDLPVGFTGLAGVVDGSPAPPIIVGASAWPTIELALDHADGVNIRWTAEIFTVLERIAARRPAAFEVSVLTGYDEVVAEPTRIDALAAVGVDRLVLGISPPHDPTRLTSFGLS